MYGVRQTHKLGATWALRTNSGPHTDHLGYIGSTAWAARAETHPLNSTRRQTCAAYRHWTLRGHSCVRRRADCTGLALGTRRVRRSHRLTQIHADARRPAQISADAQISLERADRADAPGRHLETHLVCLELRQNSRCADQAHDVRAGPQAARSARHAGSAGAERAAAVPGSTHLGALNSLQVAPRCTQARAKEPQADALDSQTLNLSCRLAQVPDLGYAQTAHGSLRRANSRRRADTPQMYRRRAQTRLSDFAQMLREPAQMSAGSLTTGGRADHAVCTQTQARGRAGRAQCTRKPCTGALTPGARADVQAREDVRRRAGAQARGRTLG
ncbi:hypothetical protein KOW79_013572 [Hemibagrus wyckioides]|uniref:Uncharacterized protein n=1 Tax=Hemibagrus wyckioides TaxID=337641 RepID=A0A9D3SHA9_9TELE|nr:hypothetical protein KOW79_013572 [Hemibagrus wyckioides]